MCGGATEGLEVYLEEMGSPCGSVNRGVPWQRGAASGGRWEVMDIWLRKAAGGGEAWRLAGRTERDATNVGARPDFIADSVQASKPCAYSSRHRG